MALLLHYIVLEILVLGKPGRMVLFSCRLVFYCKSPLWEDFNCGLLLGWYVAMMFWGLCSCNWHGCYHLRLVHFLSSSHSSIVITARDDIVAVSLQAWEYI
jgi:hypothetical protein